MMQRIGCLLLFLFSFSASFGQAKRQITKSDQAAMQREARKIVEDLQEEYNTMLSMTTSERTSRLATLTIPGLQRIFIDDQVVIENDFAEFDVAGMSKQEREKKVEEYFYDVARNFGTSDDGEAPNSDKSVLISNILTSVVQAESPRDSMYVSVLFDIAYDGKARNGYLYKPSQRIAEMRLMREGERKTWRAYLVSIRFFDPETKLNNPAKAVPVVEDAPGKEFTFEQAIVTENKVVKLQPLLKAFPFGDRWGLLNDLDRKVIVQPKYCDIDTFSDDGLALVCLDSYWGYINQNGEEVIACQYIYAERFQKGKARVQQGASIFTIDLNGALVK